MRTITYNTNENLTTTIYTNCSYKYYKSLITTADCVLISSHNVQKLYPEIFANTKSILISDSESDKNINTVVYIIDQLLAFGCDRNYYLVGIGGGVVCDITGFVAKIFMRGTKFGLIPTTLLAQVDAAIGGKNGINYNETKNLIGSFNNPEFIINDSLFLNTLSNSQYKSGLGEVIKYALIGNHQIYNYLINNKQDILNRNTDILEQIVNLAAKQKAEIVAKDPNDKNFRHVLNFGHTIGHSIELSENLPHGIAVIKGINAAIDLSVKFELLAKHKADEIKELLIAYDYDISYTIDKQQIAILSKDKKKDGNEIQFVLLDEIGSAVIKKLPIGNIENILL